MSQPFQKKSPRSRAFGSRPLGPGSEVPVSHVLNARRVDDPVSKGQPPQPEVAAEIRLLNS